MEDKTSQSSESILPDVASTASSNDPATMPVSDLNDDSASSSSSNNNQTAGLQQNNQVANSSDLLEAGDVDLIEREWVEKAKAIVKSTHGDPYVQNKELSKFKAGYIKKRFNKDIKVSE